MQTIYLRKEKENVWFNGYPYTSQSVCYYRDPAGNDRIGKNPYKSAPTRGNKFVMWNCSKYPCVWLDDLI